MPSSVRKEGKTAFLTVEGKLGIGQAVDEFRAKWSDALTTGCKFVVVNLTQVPMVDSTGIGTLIRCHSAVSAGGGKMKLVGANATVRQALKVTRLDHVFDLHETEASAVASLGA